MRSPDLTLASADRLRFRQLKLIVALGEQGTLRRAAVAINATQPTATKMLAEVEDIMGVRMYERGPRGLTANGAGRELLTFATGVMSEFARLIGALEARQSGGVGELVVGAILGMTADVIAQAVVEMKQQWPLLTIKLRGETSDNVLAMLEARTVDVAVGRFNNATQHSLYSYEPLGEETLCLVARSGHALAQTRKLKLRDVAGHRWVMHSMANPARQILDLEFGKAGLAAPNDIIEANSILTVFRILERSDAIAMLSESLIRDQIRAGLLCRLPIKIDARLTGFGLLTRRGEPLQGTAAEFADRIRAIARNVVTR